MSRTRLYAFDWISKPNQHSVLAKLTLQVMEQSEVPMDTVASTVAFDAYLTGTALSYVLLICGTNTLDYTTGIFE